MADFCKECFKRNIVPGALDEHIVVSDKEDICEECGEIKLVVVEYDPYAAGNKGQI